MDGSLFLTRQLRLLALLELKLSIVHYAAHRWLRVRDDLYKVKFSLLGNPLRFCYRHDPDVVAFRIDETNLGDGDILVDAVPSVSAYVLTLQNSAAAARDLIGKVGGKLLQLPRP